MPTELPKTIVLRGPGEYEEAVAAGAITPGHLLARNSDGAVVVHPTGGGAAEPIFAKEDALQGRTIDDAYASAEQVFYTIAKPGDLIYGFLAAGESVDPSSFLSSNGDGTFKEAGGTDERIAAPEETLDNSASGASDARLKLRVL